MKYQIGIMVMMFVTYPLYGANARCYVPTQLEALNDAKAVFVGKVISVTDPGLPPEGIQFRVMNLVRPVRIRLVVEKVFRGKRVREIEVVTNTGGLEARIEWGDTPAFFVRRTSFGPDSAPFFTEQQIVMRAHQARDATAEVVSTIIRPGATEYLAFAALVPDPGIYLLSFRGPVAPQDHKVSVEAGAAEHNPTSWTAHRYIVVTEPPSLETTSPAV